MCTALPTRITPRPRGTDVEFPAHSLDLDAMLALPPRDARTGIRSGRAHADLLTREQRLALYRYMRMTRTLEERLVALYRQTKVVGGLFRSLGQEADAVGSAFALERRDVMSPLIRNMGSMLVKGATPVEILRQYMAKGDSPTRGRELNIHFGGSAARIRRPDLSPW